MMITGFLLATVVGLTQEAPAAHANRITVGWHDELNRVLNWQPLKVDNKAKTSVGQPGSLTLSLSKVPEGWPYEYQWSGVTQKATVDVARFPVLMARVDSLSGYAHLDIDVLDAKGQKVKGFRSSTLTAPGITSVDLSGSLDPAKYQLAIRMIVGGPNEGCSATYKWIRFVSPQDAAFLSTHPDWQNVTSRIGR